MNISQGPHYVDDLLTFSVTSHRFDTGALTDADSVPSYRVYEAETGTAILTGSMAKLDDSNTTGFYSEELTLSAANGFEPGKTYNIYVTAAVNGVTGGASGAFKVSDPTYAGVIDQGTAQAATATTLQLRAGAAFANDELIGATILITGGSTGVGQRAIITDYVGSTDTATVPTWTVTPTGTITYKIFATASGMPAAEIGAAVLAAAAASPITANTTQWGGTAVASAVVLAAANIASDAISAAKIAADAGAEIATAVWASATRLLTAGTNIVLAKGTGITGFTDLDASSVGAAVLAAAAANPIDASIMEVNGSTAGVDKLAAHLPTVLKAIVGGGSSSTGVVLNASTGINGGAPSSSNNFYNGRVLVFTSGTLAGQAAAITDYDGDTKTLTVAAMTGAPSAADTAVIV